MVYLRSTLIESKEPLYPKLLHYLQVYMRLENGIIVILNYITPQISHGLIFG